MRNRLRVIPSAARDLLFNGRALGLCVLGLVAAFSSAAQAQEPVPLAHGNVPGEPHHHLKIENEYVRVYYVEVPPHEDTQLHQHNHDYIYVSLGPADVVNGILNKPEIHLQLKDGETHFTRGGFAHVARNLADTPFRNITIELLKPQTDVRNECEKVALDLAPVNCNNLNPRGLFWTEQIHITEVSTSNQESYTEGDSRAGRLLVVEDGSHLDVEIVGGPPKSLHGGEVAWLDGQRKWKVTTPGGTTTRFLVIQFKNSPAQ